MQRNGSAFCGSATSLAVRYTGKPVSGWGGLVAIMRYFQHDECLVSEADILDGLIRSLL